MSQPKKQPTPAPDVAPTSPAPAATAPNPFVRWGLVLMLLVSTFLAYRGALNNDFVDWDDYTYVIENELVRNEKVPVSEVFKRPVSLNYHPLTIWTMRLNNNQCKTATADAACTEGISARPFIMGNILLHLLNVVLVFALMYNLTKNQLLISFFIALVFGIHPMHVESVAWVSERKDVLYTFFFLLGLVGYTRYLQQGERNTGLLIGVLITFVLACLSKAMAVVFPVVMVLIAYWKHDSTSSWTSLRAALSLPRLVRLAPFFMVSLFFGLMAVKIQAGGNFLGLLDIQKNTPVAINDFNTFKIIERLHFASYGYCQYIINFFIPNDLATFYPYPDRVSYDSNQLTWHLYLLGWLGSLGVAAFLLAKSNQLIGKIYVVGIGFYFVTVALVLQFLSVGVVIMADRYTYLPYVGLTFALLMPLANASKSVQMAAWGILATMSMWWGFQTVQQVETWRDSEALWTRVIDTQKGGNIEQAYSIRGNAYGKAADKAMRANKPQEVEALLNKAFNDFQMAIQLKTQRTDVYEGMGNIFGMRGNYPEALKNYSQAIALDPQKPSVYFNRGVTYSLLKQWKEAANDFTKAEQLGNDKPLELRTNRALAYINAGDYKNGLADLEWLTQQQPQNYAHFTNRGICKANLGDSAGARADYQRALQLNPTDAFTKQLLDNLR